MLARIAEKSGKRPSEIARIGCTYCAWCFDETLVALEARREHAAYEQAKVDAQVERDREQAKGDLMRIVRNA